MTKYARPIPIPALLFVAFLGYSGCRGENKHVAQSPQVDSAANKEKSPSSENNDTNFKLTTTAFHDGAPIPRKYAGEGEDVSPPFAWDGVPEGTKEFALICDDPDARSKNPWVHWVIYGIGAEVRALPESLKSGVGELSAPIAARQGENFFDEGNTVGYRGPMPPPGRGTHHYHFKLYALDKQLDLPPGATKPQLLEAMKGHVLGETRLIGTYER